MNDSDFWLQEEFEDAITRGLIACFESRPAKNRGSHPKDRLRADDLVLVRSAGLYCPGKARVIFDSGFDTTNDPLPRIGTVLLPGDFNKKPDEYSGYCAALSVRKLTSLPRGIEPRGTGAFFQMMCLFPNYDGRVHGEKRYFTISKDGNVTACERTLVAHNLFGQQEVYKQWEASPRFKGETEWIASMACQFLADERFVWRIEAIEKSARVRLGCEREEVKSLVYARELPLTVTGRKRPILHLVASHRRRMKSGIEVDIDEFLRGTREIVMDGTRFVVHPPKIVEMRMKKSVSRGVHA